MATREELGLKVGDIAVFTSWYKMTPLARSGADRLDDPEVNNITVSVGIVRELNSRGTVFQVLATSTDETFEPHYQGKITSMPAWWHRILNAEGKGDPQLEKQLENVGISIIKEPMFGDPTCNYYQVVRTKPQTPTNNLSRQFQKLFKSP